MGVHSPQIASVQGEILGDLACVRCRALMKKITISTYLMVWS